MDRRTFLRTATIGTLGLGIADRVFAAEKYFSVKADQSLFETINRAKDPSNKTPLEKFHAPVITAPETVTAGTPFNVEVSVGEVVHSMGATHWIESIELNIGNEPAGRRFPIQWLHKTKGDLSYSRAKRSGPFRQGHSHCTPAL